MAFCKEDHLSYLVEIFGEELQEIVKEFDYTFYFSEKITLKDWIGKIKENVNEQDFFSDGVHPSQLTYQVWGKEIAKGVWEEEMLKGVHKIE